jgi:hypothetical protein
MGAAYLNLNSAGGLFHLGSRGWRLLPEETSHKPNESVCGSCKLKRIRFASGESRSHHTFVLASEVGSDYTRGGKLGLLLPPLYFP